MKNAIYKYDTVRAAKAKLGRVFTRKRLAIGGGILGLFLIVTPILTYMHFAQAISDRGSLMNRDRTGIVIRDKNGEILYSYGNVSGRSDVPLNEISDNLENAVLASEDQEFYKHEGYSVKGITRAMYANLLSKDATRYGGSTITQQLVKNKLLGNSKNYLRKYQEMVMSVAIEQRYSKSEIMEMYLNSVYFGEGAFGIDAAAKTYFNKSPQELSLSESSMLVGLLPAPSLLSPVSGDKAEAVKQQNRVLTQMVEGGYISEVQKEATAKTPVNYAPVTQKEHRAAQHFSMLVLEELYEKYGEENMIRAGYEVTTTLDLNWQKQAEAQIRERIEQLKSQGATNASMVAIDPKTGEIRVMVGSVNWDDPTFGKVNMAVSPRQPGSSFKPIYYSEALDKKLITAGSILNDKKQKFGEWQPENYDLKYRGDVTVRSALAQSLNIPSVEVIQKLGVHEASQTANRMGITTVTEPDKYGLSLALGTAEVRVLDMANAYAAFANRGEQYNPIKITSIKDKFNKIVYTQEKQIAKRALSSESAFLVSSILSDNKARAPIFGNSLTIPNREVAVKTGTTNDSRDAWTIGYTPGLSIGVWVGNNQNQPMTNLVGSNSAGAIWRGTMSSLIASQPNEKFEPPATIIKKQICNTTGRYDEFFIKSTEPGEACEIKKEEKKQEKKEEKKQPEEEIKPQKNETEGEGGRGGGGQTTLPPPPEPVDSPEPPVEEEPEDPPPDTGTST